MMIFRKGKTNMYHKKTSKTHSKKLVLFIVLVVLCLAAAGGIFYKQRRDNSKGVAATNPPGTEKIDLSPPTDADTNAVNQHKDELGKQQQNSAGQTGNTNQKKQVTPIITSASKTEVRAYVPGIVEDGGTCTVTATQGSQTITQSSSGFDNVSYTQCAPISLSLGSGSWTVVVAYSSASSTGQSQARKVE